MPALSTRRAETEVELRDGQSFVLSGLLDHRTTEALGRVPGIGKVPVLGEFFRSHNNTHSVTELVFVVTAHLVEPNRGERLVVRPTPDVQPSLAEPYMTQHEFDYEVHPKQDAPATFPN